MKIEEVEGIGEVYGAKLRDAGVVSVEDLLATAGPAQGRKTLAESTGISPELLLTWTNHADLFRLNGVGSEYAGLLEACGVDSCPELAQRNPANLVQTMSEANAVRNFVRRLPTEEMVAGWIEQAKGLPKVVTH